mgnify:CR=1 FL=1
MENVTHLDKCLICAREKQRIEAKYCSRECFKKSKIGKASTRKNFHPSKETKEKLKKSMLEQYKTGKRISPFKDRHITPWNKGKKYPEYSNKNNGNWKGEKVSYSGIHNWLAINYIKHTECDFCKIGGIRIVWANKTGKYLREREDWLCLCYKCHNRMDKKRKIIHRYSKEICTQ